MAYNYFPMNYQPMQFQQPVMQTPVNSTGIIWVQGEAGAKAYPVANGNSVLLMDSERSYFYIKTTDNSGIPQPIRKFSYEEETEKKEVAPVVSKVDTSKFITREEFEKRLADLTPVEREVVKEPPKQTQTKK